MNSPFADLLDKGQLTDKAREKLEMKFKPGVQIGVDLSLPPTRDYTVMLMSREAGPIMAIELPKHRFDEAGKLLREAALKWESELHLNAFYGPKNLSIPGEDLAKEEDCKALEVEDKRSYARKMKPGERRAITKRKKHAKKMRRRNK